MEPKRIVHISFAVVSVLLFFLFQQMTGFIWDTARLPLYQEWVVSLPDLVALALALIVFAVASRNEKATTFCEEVVVELKKVTYPLRKEAVVSAAVVIIMVGIASIVLFVFDSIWGTVTQSIFA